MGIPVNCPNGHHFSVKDKYAGKKGICPYCEGQVVVRVPKSWRPKCKTLTPRHAERKRGACR